MRAKFLAGLLGVASLCFAGCPNNNPTGEPTRADGLFVYKLEYENPESGVRQSENFSSDFDRGEATTYYLFRQEEGEEITAELSGLLEREFELSGDQILFGDIIERRVPTSAEKRAFLEAVAAPEEIDTEEELQQELSSLDVFFGTEDSLGWYELALLAPASLSEDSNAICFGVSGAPEACELYSRRVW